MTGELRLTCSKLPCIAVHAAGQHISVYFIWLNKVHYISSAAHSCIISKEYFSILKKVRVDRGSSLALSPHLLLFQQAHHTELNHTVV